MGDSLEGRINAALARSRFGVVVLSRAFFAKTWPQRELAGLAAREVAAGDKVILPVWHDIDRDFLLAHSPVLADRLGALTSAGIPYVADEICRALDQAQSTTAGTDSQPVIQPAVAAGRTRDPGLTVPRNAAERAALLDGRPMAWEYLLFAGVLLEGKQRLELKWHDHQLRLPRGSRRELTIGNLGREFGWLSSFIEATMRVFDPATQELAFGAPGEPGDPVRIEHFAQRVVDAYEALMDWAASLRNASFDEEIAEIIEVAARMVDQPIGQIREFVDAVVREVGRIPEELAADRPVHIHLALVLSIDEAVQRELSRAFRRLERR